MVATSLDSRAQLIEKYWNAKSNLKALEEKDCAILHEVDAHTVSKHPVLRRQKFDRIVFNFPHAGQLWLYREHNPIQIELHKDLVRGFLKSARKLLANNGEIHITHKTAHPFDRWNIEELASEANLYLVDEVEFYRWDYPGYSNKKGEGHGSRCDESFHVGACSTFKFGKL